MTPAASAEAWQALARSGRYSKKRRGRYLPDGESTLVDEIGQNITRVVNTCGFDMIYLNGAEAMAARNTDPEELSLPKARSALPDKDLRDLETLDFGIIRKRISFG